MYIYCLLSLPSTLPLPLPPLPLPPFSSLSPSLCPRNPPHPRKNCFRCFPVYLSSRSTSSFTRSMAKFTTIRSTVPVQVQVQVQVPLLPRSKVPRSKN